VLFFLNIKNIFSQKSENAIFQILARMTLLTKINVRHKEATAAAAVTVTTARIPSQRRSRR